jgi:hypothetical protein
VRNGLGQTTRALLDVAIQPLRGAGVATLSLREPLDAAGLAASGTREPFAGSVGYVVEYAEAPDATPAWPWMRQGFLGGAATGSELRQLGIDVGHGRHGGPVLDASGRLAGMALDNGNGTPVWLPAPRWQLSAADVQDPSSRTSESAPPAARTAPDEVYERALRLALQVIVAS